MAHLNRALTGFRAAVDRAYPNRDRSSDGWIGDPDHQARDSDHNPDPDGSVDAWDMDVDLRSGADAAAIEGLKNVFEAHPGARYWIHNRVIAHRNSGWRREPYTGDNPHDRHVHWNSNEATEDSTAPWNVEDDMLTTDQAKQLAANTARTQAMAQLDEEITTTWSANPTGKEQIPLVTALKSVAADVAELKARPAAGTVVITDEQLERVLRKVLGMAPAT